MMRKTLVWAWLLLLCAASCRDYTPKPSGYFRIDQQVETYTTYQDEKLSFDLPSDAVVNAEKKGADIWLTIRFPHYRAYLYCTYLPIDQGGLKAALDDSYRMAFSHTVKANGIEQQVLSLPALKTGGILYKINGNVATPRQFFLTDSLSHFFRASLYFDGKVNADSLLPVVRYMDVHLHQMISTLRWKK